ncbi:flocculation protein FLO11 [Aedes aegypti]|uniref:Uncharacterized protein n=1 Tax=Aedes aegypti TaxID=7159 RepID=A0A6I8TAZ9_AEDAE|nr:flocculation protein FLO11 [Aedes aegypti]XP_021696855.1 flocculation protein FLO11 [Aedes aegypti]XP_021696856.1 flocculation protein FLO11 [Aedes aegypti]XP_021696857.1 flocculation protein FLO11 [Aedes aegypti]XP_021696858.1 flocculation protein FLO11 [Aedes aegypti]XP_021696859.1 flocculation protein FLO11 [Aedes aegypti]
MSKTIETRLQSNEVRIPKKTEFDVSSSAAPSQYFKSSFARSLSFSQSGGSPYGAGGSDQHHFTRSLDFEVNFGLATIPDQPSSAVSSSQTTPSASPVYDPERDGTNARTKLVNGIATSNGGVVKTLWNYSKGSDSRTASPAGTPTKLSMATVAATASLVSSHPPASSVLPSGSGSSSSTRKSVEANEIEVLRLRKECQNLIEENRRLVNLAANSGYAINGVMNGAGSSSNGTNGILGSGGAGSGSGSSSLSNLGLGLAGGGPTYSNVETVILQTQVETLQWQLKQVDSSRHMYRAVMEEVVRYLDRCYRSLDALQPNVIGRSKSVLQVSKVHTSSNNNNSINHDSDSSSASSPRARSSTNLNDVQKSYTKKQQELLSHHHQQQQLQSHPATSSGTATPLLDEDYAPPSPASSYSTFRDFTWRRSPKRTQTLPISSVEVDPEKLAQEAFRLLRTVQNLLNTQEPTLSQSSTALDSLLLASAAGSATGSTSTLTGVGGASGGPSSATVHHHHHHHHMPGAVEAMYGGVVNARSNVAFSRKLNMRGSRLSLRSSTDDSVHSTSSSNKTETDEDNTDRPSPPLGHHLHHPLVHQHQNSGGSSSSSSTTSSNSGHLINHRHSANIDRIKEMMISSSAEDESGFSSMNSFQEIGLPLINSTILSSSSAASSTTGVCSADSNSSAASSTGSVSFVSDESSDMRDNTVIPTNNATTIAINPPSTVSSSSSNSTLTNTSKQLSDKLGIPSSSSSKAPEIPARITQSPAYEHHNHFINHRRWDSAPVVPPKLKLHGTDSDGGVSSRVLWV